jgi:carbon-monoxide dehydrogenase iron sulfur subunit
MASPDPQACEAVGTLWVTKYQKTRKIRGFIGGRPVLACNLNVSAKYKKEDTMRSVFLNPDKCVGCRHCELACVLEHSSHTDIISYALGKSEAKPRLKVKTGVDFIPFPNRCRHCQPAPCEQACPSGAIFRDQETNAVLLDARKCISCFMCVMLCPFSSIAIMESEDGEGRQKALKCDACVDRLKRHEQPACVQACKTGALQSGEAEELVEMGQQSAAVDMTLAAQGLDAETLPENLRMFRTVQRSIAELGPMPAGRDFLHGDG